MKTGNHILLLLDGNEPRSVPPGNWLAIRMVQMALLIQLVTICTRLQRMLKIMVSTQPELHIR